LEFKGRVAPRVESDNLLAFRLFDPQGREVNEGTVKTLDISRTGIAIETPYPMENGYHIELTIGMGDEVVKAKGVVQNQKQIKEHVYHVGIEFDFLTEEDLNRIGMVYPEVLK